MRLDNKGASSNKAQSGLVSNSNTSNPSTPRKVLSNGSSTHSGGDSNGVSPAVKTVARPTGPFFGHNREEVTRILIQSLTDLGYHGAAGVLSRESGYELENTSVGAFRTAIQEGDWTEAETLLFGSRSEDDKGGVELIGNGYGEERIERTSQRAASHPILGLPLAEGANQKEMLFLIRQQRYLELLERRNLTGALTVLREELEPLHQDREQFHALTSLLMCNTAEKLRRDAGWDGASGESRTRLLSDLSTSIAPEVMIPEHRLAVLLDHVQQNQINSCLYHNTVAPPSLYHDHICDESDFPSELLTELRDHTDEVWHLAFSPSGSMLATASADSSIYIYSTTTYKPIMRLSSSTTTSLPSDSASVPPPAIDVPGIGYIAWSPNEHYLLACAQAKEITIYDLSQPNEAEKLMTLDHFEHPVTSAAWLPDGTAFVVASQDTRHGLEMFRLGETTPCHSFTGPNSRLRFSDCAITPDGKRLVAGTVYAAKCVYVYDLESPERPVVAEFAMEDKVNCLSVSADGKGVLVGLEGSGLWLLDVVSGEVKMRFEGLRAESFVIRSAFGGAGGGFVVSGSEDSKVYIWKTQSGVQVACLEDVNRGEPTNAVAWHPTHPGIFASGGDDRRVKIWASPREAADRRASIRAGQYRGEAVTPARDRY